MITKDNKTSTFFHLVSFVIFIILFGCNFSKSNEESRNVIEIDINNGFKSKRIIELSTIAKNIEYVKLETNPNCLISHIKKIKITEDYIFIQDKLLKYLLVFDIKGNFICKFSNFGKGPHEYNEIRDFSFNKDNEMLYIFDRPNHKILSFSLGQIPGEEFFIKEWPSEFEVINSEYIAFFNPRPFFNYSQDYSITITNNKGKIVKRLKRNNKNGYDINDGIRYYNLYFSQDTLSYWESYSDTIYRIAQNILIPMYYIDFSGKMPKDLFAQDLFYNQNRVKYNSIHNLVETSNFFFIGALKKQRLGGIVYNKITKEAYNCKSGFDKTRFHTGFNNNFDGGLPFWPKGVTSNGKLISYFDILEYKNFKNETIDNDNNLKIQYPEKNRKLIQIIDGSSITDNPIIMLVSLK